MEAACSRRLASKFERDRQRIGVLHISSEGDALHIRDLQLAPEARGAGGARFF